jgi:2-polyprenyl-6-methoxyphenol hydroxylase-like FAD-dependent oxidoreductase
MLACRRTTFEWVLRSIVLGLPHVEIRDGAVVSGLVADAGSPPVVTGVRLDDGSVLPAEVVVAANGRRGDVPGWLRDVGVVIDETEEDTGIVYLSRFYRLRPGASVPEQAGPIGGDLGYLKYATFLGDNHTFSVTFAVPTHDDELRSLLLHPDRFELVARELPATREWVDTARADPITPVHVMARLLNRLRRFVADDGSPLVLGFHAVGDAHTCTNPLYGRGCSLAMVQATLLADAMAAAPFDLATRARLYEEASQREVEPWYHAAVAQDGEVRRGPAPVGAPAADESDPRTFMRAVLRDGLLPAMRTDATVLRAFVRTFNLLTPPDALLRDTDVISRVLNVYNDRANRPPEPLLGPATREALLASL